VEYNDNYLMPKTAFGTRPVPKVFGKTDEAFDAPSDVDQRKMAVSLTEELLYALREARGR